MSRILPVFAVLISSSRHVDPLTMTVRNFEPRVDDLKRTWESFFLTIKEEAPYKETLTLHWLVYLASK